MATLNGLPLFKIRISDDLSDKTGWDELAFVDYPAIETNFVALASQDKKMPMKFSFNAEKKLVYGPILIPDMPIYRYDSKQGEYYVAFEKETIQQIVRKRQRQNKNLAFNLQHNSDVKVDAVLQEIWITGKSDKSQDFGFDLPEGSAFVVSYVEDDKFWNEYVKTGKVKGYSIEGWLDMELKKQIKQNNMSDNKKFVEAKTNQGTLKTSAEAFTEGVDAMIVDANGQESPANGEYELENGTKIVCVEGKVTAIEEMMSQDELSDEEVAALSKMFGKALKPVLDRIEAIETKMANTPGAPAKTGNDTDSKGTEKLSPAQTALEKVNQLRVTMSKNQKTK
jgi:hypothetical protein